MYEYSDSGLSTGMGVGFWIVFLLYAALMIVSYWKIYEKAGQPGWAALIPIYNLWVLLQIIGKPGWWILLMMIPCVNIVIAVIIYIELAKVFDKSIGFAIGMLILPFIFFPILAFGDAEYA